MNRLLIRTMVFLSAVCLDGSTAVPGVRITVDRTTGTADVEARNASLGDLIRLAELRSGTFVTGTIPDRLLTLRLQDVPLDALVDRIAREAGLILLRSADGNRLADPDESLVTLNVVHARLDAIVESLARQCGIRNVMIDQGLDRKGTFVLENVPCSTALPIVFETLGIGGELHPNSILVVRGRH